MCEMVDPLADSVKPDVWLVADPYRGVMWRDSLSAVPYGVSKQRR